VPGQFRALVHDRRMGNLDIEPHGLRTCIRTAMLGPPRAPNASWRCELATDAHAPTQDVPACAIVAGNPAEVVGWATSNGRSPAASGVDSW